MQRIHTGANNFLRKLYFYLEMQNTDFKIMVRFTFTSFKLKTFERSHLVLLCYMAFPI